MDPTLQSHLDKIKGETNVITKAKLLQFLNKEKDIAIKDIAIYLSTSSASICNIIRILKLPEIIIDGYYDKLISYTHLLIISRLNNPDEMIQTYEKVLSGPLTTAQTEEEVRRLLYNIETKGGRLDSSALDKLEDNLKDIDPDLNVKIVQTRVGARVMLKVKGDLDKSSSMLQKLSQRVEAE